jgi:microcystin-dependent protein
MEPFIGQIILFAGNFAPRGWAFCNGQLLAINSNQALFSILGTTYGGDGRSTFALPDLRGRAPIGTGQGPGLTDRRLGARTGTETNVLNTTQLPAHTHAPAVQVATSAADDGNPNGRVLAGAAADTYTLRNPTAALAGVTSNSVGNNQPINNMPPVLAMNYIIALVGIFPARN